jgi:hypothetical protein
MAKENARLRKLKRDPEWLAQQRMLRSAIPPKQKAREPEWPGIKEWAWQWSWYMTWYLRTYGTEEGPVPAQKARLEGNKFGRERLTQHGLAHTNAQARDWFRERREQRTKNGAWSSFTLVEDVSLSDLANSLKQGCELDDLRVDWIEQEAKRLLEEELSRRPGHEPRDPLSREQIAKALLLGLVHLDLQVFEDSDATPPGPTHALALEPSLGEHLARFFKKLRIAKRLTERPWVDGIKYLFSQLESDAWSDDRLREELRIAFAGSKFALKA